MLNVGVVCRQALCSIAAPAIIGSIGDQLVRFDDYAAKR